VLSDFKDDNRQIDGCITDTQTEGQTDNREKYTIRNNTKEYEDKGSNNEH